MADMRTWEQLTPKERSDRISKYQADLKQNPEPKSIIPKKAVSPAKKKAAVEMGNLGDLVRRRSKQALFIDERE